MDTKFRQVFAAKRDNFYQCFMYNETLFAKIAILKSVSTQIAEEMYLQSYLAHQIIRVNLSRTFHKLTAICIAVNTWQEIK